MVIQNIEYKKILDENNVVGSDFYAFFCSDKNMILSVLYLNIVHVTE